MPVSRNRIFKLLSAVRKLGATRVIVSYDGGGDSGQIDHVQLFDASDNEIKIDNSITVTVPTQFDVYCKGKCVQKKEMKEMELRDALIHLCEDHLSQEGIDWYNNDGGYGSQEINVLTGGVVLKHNQRITDSEYSEHSL